MSLENVSTIDDVRIDGIDDLVSPNEIIARYPVPTETAALIEATRSRIAKIMRGEDPRLLVVIGPAPFMMLMQRLTTRKSLCVSGSNMPINSK